MRLLIAVAFALLAAPVVSADEWDTDYPPGYTTVADSTCQSTAATCIVAFACTGGSPNPAVDKAFYCAGRAADEALPITYWAIVFGEVWVDFALFTPQLALTTAHGASATTVDNANGVLCADVWSYFCSNPLEVPSEMPINDPWNNYPVEEDGIDPIADQTDQA